MIQATEAQPAQLTDVELKKFIGALAERNTVHIPPGCVLKMLGGFWKVIRSERKHIIIKPISDTDRKLAKGEKLEIFKGQFRVDWAKPDGSARLDAIRGTKVSTKILRKK